MNFKPSFLFALLLLTGQPACSQDKTLVNEGEVQQIISYLASDELRGRGTGDRGNDMAASFIAQKFQAFGLSPLPGQKGYFQEVQLTEGDFPEAAGHKDLRSSNVLGMVRGTDAALQHEYLVLSAHFDHLGIGKPQILADGKVDSIYNGARDNAIGVAAILEAARYFSKNPARRAVVIIGFTAEELGLLGSKWYVEHPIVPLDQTVFNLNIDGAGYNDTSLVTIIGLDRTTASALLREACEQTGLKTGTDPTPGKFLFNASDNLNFAKHGVPSVTFSEGFTAFDHTIKKYYHQVTDEASSLDYDYIARFCSAYIKAAELIANDPEKPAWTKGDFYEGRGAIGK